MMDETTDKCDSSEKKATFALGIPEFWLTTMKSSPVVSEMITEQDEEALQHLEDIRFSYLDDNPVRPSIPSTRLPVC